MDPDMTDSNLPATGGSRSSTNPNYPSPPLPEVMQSENAGETTRKAVDDPPEETDNRDRPDRGDELRVFEASTSAPAHSAEVTTESASQLTHR